MRDLGIALARAKRFGPARQYLSSYLERRPEDPQSIDIEALLKSIG